MGKRVAHLVTGSMTDFVEFDDFAIARTAAPEAAFGKTLQESGLRNEYRITIVAVKSGGGEFEYAGANTVVQRGDELIVSGPTKRVERFAADA